MRVGIRAWRALLLLATLLLACTDTGLVGQDSVCTPACAADKQCDTQHKRCVACLVDGDCKSNAAPYCDPDNRTCVACRGDTDCTTALPFCVASQCHACMRNADCGVSGQCENGACIRANGTAGESDDKGTGGDHSGGT